LNNRGISVLQSLHNASTMMVVGGAGWQGVGPGPAFAMEGAIKDLASWYTSNATSNSVPLQDQIVSD
jgi:hypothetical protein